MENLQWLLENGGPAIKLRLVRENLIDASIYGIDANKLAEELLQLEKVNTAMTYFDRYKDFRSMSDRELYGFIHGWNENCFETFMPFFTNLGFQAGITAFDEKVEYMCNTYRYIIAPDESGEIHWTHIYGLMIISNLLKAGYYYDDMLAYMSRIVVDNVYKVAENNIFDFYETDPSKIRSGRPKRWQNRPIIKDIHNCEAGEMPLPTTYHVEGMLNIYEYVKADETKEKIDGIIQYILDPRYQKTGGNYGIHYDGLKKTYHSSSSGLALPNYESDTPSANMCLLEKLSLSPVMRKSEWFEKCMADLEQYRTERGTYSCDHFKLISNEPPCNPDTFCSAFIDKNVLPEIKKSERRSFAFELCATLYMAILKNRIGCSK